MSEAVLSSSGTSLVRSMSVKVISDHSDLSFDFFDSVRLTSPSRNRALKLVIAMWPERDAIA